jgi:pimeloyl-ACP methyl ester carboxylesterase
MKTLVLLALSWSTLAFARTQSTFTKSFVQVSEKRKLYTEVRLPQNGKPTLYLVNGLTYSTEQWKPFAEALSKIDPDLGLVLYDMEGMGQTLLAEAPVYWDIPFENQVADLHTLKQKLAIPGPSFALGLSYGGAVILAEASENPSDFDGYIAMSPFIERIPEQDVWIKNSIVAYRMTPVGIMDPRSDDELYDVYLRTLVYTTYPAAEPIVLENPYKLEAIYRMVKGAKNWSAVGRVARFPKGKMHVVAARDDEYVKFDRMQIFLEAAKRKLNSTAIFEHSHHKIPEEEPGLAAAWVYQILSGNPNLAKGLTFDVDPATDTATSGGLSIPLRQKSSCESLL